MITKSRQRRNTQLCRDFYIKNELNTKISLKNEKSISYSVLMASLISVACVNTCADKTVS